MRPSIAWFVLALCVYAVGIAREPLWFDEALTAQHVSGTFAQMLAGVAQYEHLPHGYFVIAWTWARLAGTSDAMLRLPSTIFAAMSVALIAWIARRFLHPRCATPAALLLLFNPLFWFHAHDARPYTLMTLLALLVLASHLLWWEEPTRRRAIGIVVFTCASYWVQPFAIFVTLAMGSVVISEWSLARLRRWILLQAIALLGFAPMIGFMLEVSRSGVAWLGPTPLPGVTFHRYLGSAWWATTAGALLLFLAFIPFLFRPRVVRKSILSLSFVPIVVPWIIDWFRSPIFTDRYGLPALVGLILWMSLTAGRWPRIIGWTLAAVVISSSFLVDRTLHRPDWRGAFAHLDRSAKPGAVIDAQGDLFIHRLASHYLTRDDLRIELTSNAPQRWTVEQTADPAAPTTRPAAEGEFRGVRLRLISP